MKNQITWKIYQILFPNGKRYIGQTINYKRRWREHLWEAFNGSQLKVYRAIRKYSIKIDAFSIIEENILTQEEANAKEKYYIKLYNSKINGYNSTWGGQDNFNLSGEDHPNAILSDKELYKLRQIRASKKYTCGEVYEFYKDVLSYSGFSKLWNYETRESIASELNTEELRSFYKSDHRQRCGEDHGNAKLSDDDVIKIREQYYVEGKTTKEIYENYKAVYSLSGFRKIIMGTSYTHLPMPAKSNKCKKRKDPLTKDQVLFIRQKYKEGYKIIDIINNWFPTYSQSSINLIVHNKRYTNY